MDPALSEKMGITKKSYSQMLHCGFLVKVISSTEVLGLSSGYLYDRPVLITPPPHLPVAMANKLTHVGLWPSYGHKT